MHVIATAGHVDHGKSTLVRALTGMEPDRWAEERRRGMTIDLGFAWATLPSGRRLAFVDVPGHERFVTNMLAGVGPAPAVMFVVAADEGWRAQSAEHLAALDALGVSRGVLVVTRADLADPGPALRQARDRLAGTALAHVPEVVVSGRTGAGLPDLVAALDRLTGTAAPPETGAAVRLWIDRAFTVRGAGTVVTGTLTAGTLRAGDELLLDARRVRVRGLQSMNEAADAIPAVARVAVNLRGVERDQAARGMTLLTPGAWLFTDILDVRLAGPRMDSRRRSGAEAVFHIGSAAVAARVRVLGGDLARLTLARALPLRIGDRGLLRADGIIRVDVLDVRPPSLVRRGAAAARAAELATGTPTAGDLLRRHGLMRRSELAAMGVVTDVAAVAGEWLADPARWAQLAERLTAQVANYAGRHPLRAGISLEEARAALDLPEKRLVEALVRPPLQVRAGRILPPGATLPGPVLAAVEQVLADLSAAPYRSPDSARLRELGLDTEALAAAVRAGLLLRIGEHLVLAPGADVQARGVLAQLRRPFTVSDARRALGTTRRVAVPLLEHLDREGLTRRVDGERRITR
ncbi:selenocysteine-specific translation elongation factor [Nonomuraea sp. NPDC050536]|uniref:selenocysteine-specific translation elongation factor n=1 Tax=Nonomuraea sp. NPDC050536 TaxID=3364366 RepID=UPI0037CA1728